jgi:hypothetical protein
MMDEALQPPEDAAVSRPCSELTVKVRRQWDDSRIATYRFEDVSGLHMSDVSGGIQARANRAYLCGYVLCDAALAGALPHSCGHGRGPHRIKVCVIKKDNPVRVYQMLQCRLHWEARLRHCPFAVDLGEEVPDADAVHAWLDEHCLPDGYVEVACGWWRLGAGWGNKRGPRGPQVWFSYLPTAAAFADCFGARLLHHQNQAKQCAAALFCALYPTGTTISRGL